MAGDYSLKKILILTIFILLILPMTSVFAADTNLLFLKKMTAVGSATNTSAVTDDNNTTEYYLASGGTLTYVFPDDVLVSSINVFLSNPSNTNLNAALYDATGKRVFTKNNTASNGINVQFSEMLFAKKIVLTCGSGSSSTILDVNLIGSVAKNTDVDKFVIKNLKYTITSDTSISLKWDSISSSFFQKYNIYKDNQFLTSVTSSSYSISQLVIGKTYEFKVSSVDSFNKEFSGSSITYLVPEPDTTPPGVPTNIKVVPDRYTAAMTWDQVKDPDLLGYYVYLNGERANATPVYVNSYNLTGLKFANEYKVQVSAVDQSWNVSELSKAVHFTTLTLDTPPDPPLGLQAHPFNGSVSLSWLPSKKASSYKVYQNNEFLVETDSNTLKISNLENGVSYSYEVSGVNDLGESGKSSTVTVIPDRTLLPDVSLGYSLKDVSTGASHWFGSIWYILAFAIAIPLSFYLSGHIKGLFSGGTRP